MVCYREVVCQYKFIFFVPKLYGQKLVRNECKWIKLISFQELDFFKLENGYKLQLRESLLMHLRRFKDETSVIAQLCMAFSALTIQLNPESVLPGLK